MRRQTIFRDMARYYDLIYSWKDYRREAATIKRLIGKYKRSKGNNLLEVACGTGGHARYLKDDFRVVATDISAEMLAVARKNVKGVVFRRADMVALDLGREFDAIICLFSSIGYVKTYARLERTLKYFARHLKPGGVVIIELWLTKSTYARGVPHMVTYGDNDIKVARLNVSQVRGNMSVMDMHHLVAERGGKVRHFVERHELAMFERKRFLELMRAAGLQARFVKNGLMKDRGLYIGVRKANRGRIQ